MALGLQRALLHLETRQCIAELNAVEFTYLNVIEKIRIEENEVLLLVSDSSTSI